MPCSHTQRLPSAFLNAFACNPALLAADMGEGCPSLCAAFPGQNALNATGFLIEHTADVQEILSNITGVVRGWVCSAGPGSQAFHRICLWAGKSVDGCIDDMNLNFTHVGAPIHPAKLFSTHDACSAPNGWMWMWTFKPLLQAAAAASTTCCMPPLDPKKGTQPRLRAGHCGRQRLAPRLLCR